MSKDTVRFSVLLPTLNGGKFLDACIRSILDQDADLELVISDNASDDETPAVIDRWRGDARVRALRQAAPLSVTENWNAALHAARGDYVLMMGDDDFLLPGYFEVIKDVILRHGHPDCILYNGYSYLAPGSIDDEPRSFFRERHFCYGDDLSGEMVMEQPLRRRMVMDMYRFRVGIPLNMQTTIIRRSLDAIVPGGIFQPPFPDHFALNALLLVADKWVFSPERLVIVGVSPKSFGHYVYSNRQESGLGYLGITADFPSRLPGNELLNGMHVWLDNLKKTFPEHLAGVRISRSGYVRRQVFNWLMRLRLGRISARELASHFARLRAGDWIGLAAAAVDRESWKHLRRLVPGRAKSSAERQWSELIPLESVRDISGFASYLETRRDEAE